MSSTWASHEPFFSKPRVFYVETVGVAPQMQSFFKREMHDLAGLPKSPKGYIALMAVVSMNLAWINGGLGIVGSEGLRAPRKSLPTIRMKFFSCNRRAGVRSSGRKKQK